MDLQSIESDPVKLAKGCYWRVRRENDGTISGSPIDGPDPEVAWLLLVPRGIAFDRALEDEMVPTRAARREGEVLSPEEEWRITGRAHGRATVKGWGNLSIGGEPLPFSEGKAIELMTEPRWRALQDFVRLTHHHLAAAAKKEEAKALGN